MLTTPTGRREGKPRASKGLFRWAGGKSHVLGHAVPRILEHTITTGGRLISLFHGMGAIERACGGAAIAADKSPELLQLFADLQTFKADELRATLLHFDAGLERTSETYKHLGHSHEQRKRPLGTARFLWLSAMAFNGIWRVNRSGEMNMGVDRERLATPAEKLFPPLEAFTDFAAGIAKTLFVDGWERALREAKSGDVVLFDPPYGEFVGYTAAGFDARDQRLLAGALREAFESNIGVIGFNAPGAAPLYHWAKVEELERPGTVSSAAGERGRVAEIMITAGLRQ